MIKPPIRTRLEDNRINRHSSQLAIRKPSANHSTPKAQQISIQNRNINYSNSNVNSNMSINQNLVNLRKTTFWMKKTMGMASIENVANVRQEGTKGRRRLNKNDNIIVSKKISQEQKSNQIFCLKVNTQNSQSNSIFHQIQPAQQIDVNAQMCAKLALIQKSQKQLFHEVDCLVSQSLPKLPSCQHLFNSLNKMLKIICRSCSSFFQDKTAVSTSSNFWTQLQKMVDKHIQTTTQIFNKVLRHTTDFIKSNKYNNLISKVIQLQKQNNKLVNRHAQLLASSITHNQQQRRDTAFRQPNRDQPSVQIDKKYCNTLQNIVSIQSIDYHRILAQNIHFGQAKQISNDKVNNICKSILKQIFTAQSDHQTYKFQFMNSMVKALTTSAEKQYVLKLYAQQIRNKQKKGFSHKDVGKTQNISATQLNLYKNTVFQLISNTSNCSRPNKKKDIYLPVIFTVKKNIQSYIDKSQLKFINSDCTKVKIQDMIRILSGFRILKDRAKYKQIFLYWLSMCQIYDHENNNCQSNVLLLTDEQIKSIDQYIDQSHTQLYTNSKTEPNLNTEQQVSAQAYIQQYNVEQQTQNTQEETVIYKQFKQQKSKTNQLRKYCNADIQQVKNTRKYLSSAHACNQSRLQRMQKQFQRIDIYSSNISNLGKFKCKTSQKIGQTQKSEKKSIQNINIINDYCISSNIFTTNANSQNKVMNKNKIDRSRAVSNTNTHSKSNTANKMSSFNQTDFKAFIDTNNDSENEIKIQQNNRMQTMLQNGNHNEDNSSEKAINISHHKPKKINNKIFKQTSFRQKWGSISIQFQDMIIILYHFVISQLTYLEDSAVALFRIVEPYYKADSNQDSAKLGRQSQIQVQSESNKMDKQNKNVKNKSSRLANVQKQRQRQKQSNQMRPSLYYSKEAKSIVRKLLDNIVYDRLENRRSMQQGLNQQKDSIFELSQRLLILYGYREDLNTCMKQQVKQICMKQYMAIVNKQIIESLNSKQSKYKKQQIASNGLNRHISRNRKSSTTNNLTLYNNHNNLATSINGGSDSYNNHTEVFSKMNTKNTQQRRLVLKQIVNNANN